MAADSAWPLLAALAVILFITLAPIWGPTEPVSTVCLFCGPYGTADFVLNVLLFAPLGYTAGFRLTDARRSMILVIALTVGIELLQTIIPGRHPTVGDIAANTLGGGIGIWISNGGSLRPLGRLLPYTLLAILAGTVASYEPSIPDTAFVGQWTPSLASFDQYEGRVIRARIGSVDLPDGLLQGPAHDSILSAPQGIPVIVEFVAGPDTRRIAPLVRVADRDEREVLLVGSKGTSIVVRMRRLAQRIRLHAPQTRFIGAHPEVGTESILVFERRGREFCIETPDMASCDSSVTPARGWFLLTGLSLPDWASALADAFWLGGLAALLVLGPRGAVTWLPTLAYLALWIVLQGDLVWFPGFLGILAAPLAMAVLDRRRGSASPGAGSV